MKTFRLFPTLLVLCCFLSLFQISLDSATAQAAGLPAPVVRKIEPPNWWADYTPDLTLLLSGDNLTGARVKSTTKGITSPGSRPSANGHYLFVQLQISSGVPAKTVSLLLTTPAGTITIQLPLLARTDSRSHFEGFSRDDVIYLIMPDRFADGDPSNNQPSGSTGVYDRAKPMAYHGGDLRGIRDHLGYLHDLGVTTLWLTPVWKNTDSDYHGYHAVDFYALDDHMGSMQEYQALVADAHKLGMKVLIDYVVNHTGPHHPWADDPPTPTWLHGTPAHHPEPSYNFSGSGRSARIAARVSQHPHGWFAGKLPDLNPDDPELAIYLAQNAMWWTEIAQLDGFRLDTFPYSTRQFWSGWHDGCGSVYPKINDVGEVADPDPTITSFFEGGRKQLDGIDSGLATVFDFPLESALRDVVIKGASMEKIVAVLQHDELYPHPETLVTFIGNHDDTRFLGEKGSNPAKLKAAFSLLLTYGAVFPRSISGDEIAMPGGDDPDNRRDFPGGFPGDSREPPSPSSGRTRGRAGRLRARCSRCLRSAPAAIPPCAPGKQWRIGWGDDLLRIPARAAGRKDCW